MKHAVVWFSLLAISLASSLFTAGTTPAGSGRPT
jgi:hypothetical protein